MANLLLPIQAGSLPSGYCFTTYQNLLNDFSNLQKAVLTNGRTYYNIGDTKPAPEFQAYPWINTAFRNLIFTFNGVWRCPNGYNANERRLWSGDLTQLVTYDGGSAGAVTPTSGPMWISDPQAEGRVPMGPGNIPGTTGPVALTVGQQYGAGEVTLSDANGAVGSHVHGFGKYLSGAAGFNTLGNFTVPAYNGAVVQGISSGTGPDTTVNLFTLPSGTGATGVNATPFSIVPPVIGTYLIKPSGRQFFVIP